MSKNTLISYMYRDGSNNKTYESIVLAGHLSADLKKKILAKAVDGDRFIPGQVGLPDLQDSFSGSASEWIEGNDTPWHEIEGIEPTSQAATPETQPVAEFAARWLAVVWDEEYRPPCYTEMAQRRRASLGL